MHEAVWITFLLLLLVSADLLYRLGRASAGGRQQQENRSSIELDLMAIGCCLGCLLGILLIDIAHIGDGFLRVVVTILGAIVGFFGTSLIHARHTRVSKRSSDVS